MHSFALLGDLVIIFSVAVVVVALLQRIGLPSIAGFLISGAIAGPNALGLVEDSKQVEILSEVGVALLLFGIGLELNLQKLKRLWRPVLIGGALQVGLTIASTIAIGLQLSYSTPRAVFFGFVVAVSSTAIVLRGPRRPRRGSGGRRRVTLGILVFQDLAVVPMMLAIPMLAGKERR
ncbi:MAG: cation:proton antiporter [Polyangiales bacterium]